MKTVDVVKRCLSRAFVLGGGALLAIAMSVPVAPAFATDAAASGQTTALEQNQKNGHRA